MSRLINLSGVEMHHLVENFSDIVLHYKMDNNTRIVSLRME